MRKYLTTAIAIALMSGVSNADLQNVEIGGDIRIRGNSYFDIRNNVPQSPSRPTSLIKYPRTSRSQTTKSGETPGINSTKALNSLIVMKALEATLFP